MRLEPKFVALLLCVPAAALAQSGMTGDWKFSVPNGGVNYIELKQTGDAISGTSSRGGPGRAISGTLHDGKLHIVVGPPGGNRTVVFDGTGSGDQYDVTRQPPADGMDKAASEQGTLVRVTHEEAHPARLPLPELRDVPDNGLARTPPMGWNSWNHYHDKFDDATVRATADAMVASGMAKAGYNYIIVDEGWSSYRDASGHIVGNARFPDMKALADYVHSKGLKIGIYSSPGPQVCGGYQGSYGHEEQDAKTFADWGYDYLKYDWCSAFGIYQPTPADLEGAYQKMGEALAKAHRPIVF